MDVKTAFLNGELEEEIYMAQPEGFVVPGKEKQVCRLVKSLYGLKQAPKQWHEKFDRVILSCGFKINDSDKCVYIKQLVGACVILCLYVDDILIFGTNLHVIKETKDLLSSNFDMKDLGPANVILGIKLIKSENGIVLSQEHYIDQLLKKFNYSDAKELSIPFDPNVRLKKNVGESVSQHRYSQIIGSLMYLSNCTRPNISYAVCKLSRYTINPSLEHWHAIERIFRYLKGTMNYGIHYCGVLAVLEGFCDANWISDSDETKATSGYVFTLGGGAIAWKSSKQSIISRSTMEAEFIALDLTCTEAEWLRNLLIDLPLSDNIIPAVSIHCDNQAAIAKAKNANLNEKRRHIRIRHNSIKQLLSQGVVALDFVRSEKNIADPFTKGLARRLVIESSRGMGLKPVS